MRSVRACFALFAAVLVAVSAHAVPPARAAGTKTSTVKLLWPEGAPVPGPGVNATLYVEVDGDATDVPTGSAHVKLDGALVVPDPLPLTPASTSKDNPKFSKSQSFNVSIPQGPHRFTTTYEPDAASAFAASDDALNLPTATLTSSNPTAPSGDPQAVRFTYTLSLHPTTPASERPSQAVIFSDGAAFAPRSLKPDAHPDNVMTATIDRDGGNYTFTAHLPPDDVFLVADPPGVQQSLPPTPTTKPSTGGVVTSTTKKPTVTTRRPSTATTGQLAPISGTTSTTFTAAAAGGVTTVTFGSFQTAPTSRGNLAAAGDNTKKKQGPPLIVVVLTLLALGVLGGIAAVRRYRRSAIDWF